MIDAASVVIDCFKRGELTDAHIYDLEVAMSCQWIERLNWAMGYADQSGLKLVTLSENWAIFEGDLKMTHEQIKAAMRIEHDANQQL